MTNEATPKPKKEKPPLREIKLLPLPNLAEIHKVPDAVGPNGRKRNVKPPAPRRAFYMNRKSVLDHMTEEEKAAARAKGGRAGKRTAVPDGYTQEQIEPIRAKAKEEAERIMKIMVEKNIIDADATSNEMLQKAIEVVRGNADGTRDRLKAMELVLKYTKAPPAQKSDVTVNGAEAFLASLLNKGE